MMHTSSTRPSQRRATRLHLLVTVASFLMIGELLLVSSTRGQGSGPLDFPNPGGVARTLSTGGPIDTRNPFFLSLGANGRACVTCHEPQAGWTITPERLQARFVATHGLDPIFRLNDGANSPRDAVSTFEDRRRAYSMLLTKGLIRVGLPVPETAEFELVGCDDPYGFASAKELSLFRRPLPTTNLRFLSAVMWDGRETIKPMTIQPPGAKEDANREALLFDLMHQSNNATRGHAEAASDLTEEQKRQIVDFQFGLSTAQCSDSGAGVLNTNSVSGGPGPMVTQPFYIGINDNVADPNGPFNGNAMQMYSSWVDSQSPYRRSIARGERLFNSKPIQIVGVKGLNDNPYFGSPPLVVGTCTTCHNTPNVGNHSLAVPLDIGLADASRRTPDLPLYTLRNRATGELLETTDPGRAMVSGKWADIGKLKGPILRGLAARAPYFHNGSAASLEEVIDFYESRFNIGLSRQEKADLAAFLRAL
jgi:cytochrome c peroxidase